MPATNEWEIFAPEKVEDQLVAVMIPAVNLVPNTVQVFGQYQTQSSDTPRIYLRLTIREVQGHRQLLNLPLTESRFQPYSVWMFNVAVEVTTQREQNGGQHRELVARARMAMQLYKIRQAWTDAINALAPYHTIIDIGELAASELVTDDAQTTDSTTLNFAGQLQIDANAWPRVEIPPFNPSSLRNFALELLADNATGSGTATGILDTSGRGNNAISEATDPVINLAAKNGHNTITFADASWFSQPATGLATLFIFVKGNAAQSPFIGTTGTVNDLRYMLSTNWVGDAPSLWSGSDLVAPFTDPSQWHILSTRHDGTTVRFYVDGFFVGANISALPSEAFQLGRGLGGNLASGEFGGWLGYNRNLPLSEYHQVDNWIGDLFGQFVAAQIIVDGNSLSTNYEVGYFESYPAQLMTLLGNSYRLRNIAVSGQTTEQMINGDILTWDTQKPSYVGKFLCIYWEGTNSIYFGATAVETYAQLIQYGQDRRNTGLTGITMDVLPRSEFDSEQETFRLELNALLAADFTVATSSPYVWLPKPGITYAKSLVRLSLQPDIGPAGSEDNPTYYIDGIHLTAAGYTIVAGLVEVAINSIP